MNFDDLDPMAILFREPPGPDGLNKLLADRRRLLGYKYGLSKVTTGIRMSAYKELIRLAVLLITDESWLEMAELALGEDDDE